MGVLIVAGTVTLVTLIVQRTGGLTGSTAPWQASLGLAEGEHITGVAGLERNLAVLVARGGEERVLVLDPRSGRVQGELRAR